MRPPGRLVASPDKARNSRTGGRLELFWGRLGGQEGLAEPVAVQDLQDGAVIGGRGCAPDRVQRVSQVARVLDIGVIRVVHGPVGVDPQQEAAGFGVVGAGVPSASTVLPSAVRRTEYGGRKPSGTVNRGAAPSRAQYVTEERDVAKLAATRVPANCSS